jgi:hypothetical protein
MLTRGQQSKYRPLVKKAWFAHCLRHDLNPEADGARESWYRSQLMDACGIYTTKQASPTKDFDALMGHFAEIVGDEYWINRAARGDEIRLRFLINKSITEGAVNLAYVQGIARNMGFRDTLENLPAEHLWKIWNALIRHNRRHQVKEYQVPF